jgi:hypothetical protein
VNEPPESSTSTDEPEGTVEPPQPASDAPAEGVETLDTEPPSVERDAGLSPADAPPTTQPPTASRTRPPRTQQILTATVLALIALSFVLLAIEIANQ